VSELLHTVIVPAGSRIGPLPLDALRERLRQQPVPDDATLVIHARLGDRLMPIGRHPQLRAASLPLENSVACPHCDTIQPPSKPGELKCVRCGTLLVISEDYIAALGSNPRRFWYLSIPGMLGIFVFTKLYPSGIWLGASLAASFGVLLGMMFRQGVAYSIGGKLTARKDPIFYGLAILGVGIFTLGGLGLFVFGLISN
jgi:hypothetical protein